jgi:hypothetical protein
MLTVEDCRRKAGEWLRAAEEATDPNTSASSRRLSDKWTALALQIEQDPYTQRQTPAAVRRPADLTERRKIGNTDTVHVADVLRERLQLSDFPMDEPPDSTSRS